jgi:FkbM family methyltransferase
MPKREPAKSDVATFSFSGTERLRFYISYLNGKTWRLLKETRSPKFRLFCYEVVYSLAMALHRRVPRLKFLRINYVEHHRGKFRVRMGTHDIAIASPAFERRDVDYLIASMRTILAANDQVLFLDIGADFGTYCITVGNVFSSANVKIVAYEPIGSSFQMLESNVELNQLDESIVLRRFALGATDESFCWMITEAGGFAQSTIDRSKRRTHDSERVGLTTLDKETHIIDGWFGEAALVMKIDCEGAEICILEGGAAFIGRFSNVFLLVEDFVDDSIVDWLINNDWELITKLKPYNSFWSLSQ